MLCLPEEFYLADPTRVARELLGKRLVRRIDDLRISGLITETEAYRGEEDLACHARSGMTQRNSVMYGLPGRAYVYFTYGMHWLLNAVCGPQGFPAAVLVRALEPVEGKEFIAGMRPGAKPTDWCSGPARLCKALDISGDMNGVYLCDADSPLQIEEASGVDDADVAVSPRVGIQYAPEPWRSMPWRFKLERKGSNSG